MTRIRIEWTGYLDPFGTSHSGGKGPTLPLEVSIMEIFRVTREDELGRALATIPDEFLALALEHGVQIHATASELDERGNRVSRTSRPKIQSFQCHGDGLSEMEGQKPDGRVIWQWKIPAKKKHPAHVHVSVRVGDEIPVHYGLFVTHRVPVWYESTSGKRLIRFSVIAVLLSTLAAVASAIAAWLR